MARKIMYTGNKPEKKDNILFTQRIWKGAGSVIEVKDEESPAYTKHGDIFEDVTELSDAKVEAKAKALREKYAPAPQTNIPVDLARSLEKRVAKLVETFAKLKHEAGHFNKDGTPKAAILEKMLGFKPDPEEVAFAWSRFKAIAEANAAEQPAEAPAAEPSADDGKDD